MTTPDTNPDSRKRLAKVLSSLGAIWIALFIVSNVVNAGGTPLGNVLGFFGDSLFFPIALLFSGRAVNRQADRAAGGGIPGSTTRRTPPILTPDQPSRPTQRSAPKPPPRPDPRVVSPPPPPVVTSPDVDELAEAIGFEDLDGKPAVPDFSPSHKTKSSEEMIAEARKRLSRDPRSRD